MADLEQARFVERLKRRDEAAFNELVLAHQGSVYRLLLRLLGDAGEAEDLAQEVFVTVFKYIESFRGDSALSTWIYRIAINHGKNRIKYLNRRERKGQRSYDENLPSHALAEGHDRPDRPDRIVEGEETKGSIERALSSLDDEQRTLLVMREVEHLSYEDMQKVTGLPLGTVKSRLHRARIALESQVKKLMEGKS